MWVTYAGYVRYCSENGSDIVPTANNTQRERNTAISNKLWTQQTRDKPSRPTLSVEDCMIRRSNTGVITGHWWRVQNEWQSSSSGLMWRSSFDVKWRHHSNETSHWTVGWPKCSTNDSSIWVTNLGSTLHNLLDGHFDINVCCLLLFSDDDVLGGDVAWRHSVKTVCGWPLLVVLGLHDFLG